MQLTINKTRLVNTVLPALFESDTTYLLELLQNAQRAKAKTVSIKLDSKQLSMVDDGVGCDDLSVLLDMASSGWSDCNENPFGMGFLSLAPVAKRAIIWSKSKKMTIDFDKLDGECADIEDAQYCHGFSVVVEPRKELHIPEYRVCEMVKHIPLCVMLNGRQLPTSMPYDYGVEYKGEGYTFYIPEKLPERLPDHFKTYAFHRPCGFVYASGVGVLRLHSMIVDLKAPDRSSLVMNDKYYRLYIELRNHMRTHLIKYGGPWELLQVYLTPDEMWELVEVELLTPMYLEQIKYERAGRAPEPGTVIESKVAPDAVSNYVPSRCLAKDVKNGVCCTKDWAFANHGLVHKLLVAGIPVVIVQNGKQLEFLESRGMKVATNIHELEMLTLTITVLEPTDFERRLIECYKGIVECPIVIADMEVLGAYRDGVIYLLRRHYVGVTPEQAALIVSVIVAHELAHAQGFDDNTKQHSVAAEDNAIRIITELLA